MATSSRISKKITNLQPGVTYTILVRAKKNGLYSDYASKTFTTPETDHSGNNFTLSNKNTDIQLLGGGFAASSTENPFPINIGKIDITQNTIAGSGTGVIMNQYGIAGFKAGTKQFSLSASTGDAYFAGTVSAGAIISDSAVFGTSGYTVSQTTSNISSAQSTATSAYSVAGSAYTLADSKLASGNGVQSDPSTKQITSINSNSGISVYSGSLSGARVILNSTGLAAYDSSGTNKTFEIVAASGAATFKGAITSGSTITGSDFKTDSSGSYINILTNSTAFGNVGSIVFHTGTGDYGATQDGGMYATPGISASTISPTLLIQSPTISGYPGKYSEIKMTGARTGDLFGRVYISADATRVYNSFTADSYLAYYINSISTDWSPILNNTYNLGYSGGSGTYAWKTIYVFSTVNPSDQRLKTDIKPSSLGLDFIKTLNPVSYKWIEGGNELIKNDEGIIDRNNLNIKSIPGKRTHWGFLAQEVKQSVDQTEVEDFGGWVIADLNDPNSNQSLNYTEFISPIVKAIQELAAKVENLEKNLVS